MTFSSLDQKLARFLRTQRGDSTYTQFARKVGLRESTLFRIENGQQSATLRAVQQILKGLHCSYTDIFAEPPSGLKIAEQKKNLEQSGQPKTKAVTYRKRKK